MFKKKEKGIVVMYEAHLSDGRTLKGHQSYISSIKTYTEMFEKVTAGIAKAMKDLTDGQYIVTNIVKL